MLVEVTSIFASGARARVKCFFILFTMVMHHAIPKKQKRDLGELRCARGPQSTSSTNSGVRAPIRVRARADYFLFFIFFRMVWSKRAYHAEEKKKWLPASRVRARTPTHSSPPSLLRLAEEMAAMPASISLPPVDQCQDRA